MGRRLTFCGGVDTHRVLPTGTPDEVRQRSAGSSAILGPGGGYLVSSVHTVMDDVPAGNILAMVDAVEAYGTYPMAGRLA